METLLVAPDDFTLPDNDPARDSRDSRSSRESGAVLVALGPPSGDELPTAGPRFSGSGCSGVEMTWKYEKRPKR
jgi:hypothetical protein